MAYDPVRQRVVLFGGSSTRGFAAPPDTWEWDGTSWTQLATTRSPLFFGNDAMVYDDERHLLVLFDGGSGATWLFGEVKAAQAARYGTGCTGTTALLSPFGIPASGTAFALDVARAGPAAPGAALVASQPAQLPLAGCTLLVAPQTDVVAVGLQTNAYGFATLRVPIVGALTGIPFYAQAFLLDAGIPRGWVATNGVLFMVGD